MSTVRGAGLVESTKVNYGIVESLQPPYINVIDFKYRHVYDTCGPAIRSSTFHVVIVAADADTAENYGEQVIGLFDNATNITPSTSRCLLEQYQIGQSSENLYQYIVDIEFRLEESI